MPRRPEITRVADISAGVDEKVEANRANKAKDRRAITDRACVRNWRRKTCACCCSGTTTQDRNYIKEFVLSRNRDLGRQYSGDYAEAFHHVASGPRIEEYLKKNVALELAAECASSAAVPA